MNKERLVFEVTDGVTTPEEVTPCEGGDHVSGDAVFFFPLVLKHSNSLYWNFTRVGPFHWPLLGVRPGIDLDISLLPT